MIFASRKPLTDRRLARVDLRGDAAEARRMDDGRDHHAVEMEVLGIDRLAGDLGFGVEPLEALADIAEVRRVLERNVLRHVELRRRFGQLAERPGPAGLVREHALRDGDLGGGHAPRRGRGGGEHGARDRARLAVLDEGVGDRGRAAGALERPEQEVVVFRGVGGREFGAHLPPIRIELFGDERRKSGGDALSLIKCLISTVTVLSGAMRTKGLGANSSAASAGVIGRSTPMMRPTPVPAAILMKVRRECWMVMAAHPFMISAAR